MKTKKGEGIIGALIGGAATELAHIQNEVIKTIIIALMLAAGVLIYFIENNGSDVKRKSK